MSDTKSSNNSGMNGKHRRSHSRPTTSPVLSEPSEIADQSAVGISIIIAVYEGSDRSCDLEIVEAAYLRGLKRAREVCCDLRGPNGKI